MTKLILCLDFDGVLHHYTSPWTSIGEINDGPTPGAMAFLETATAHFDVQIFSSRSKHPDGLGAMQRWVKRHLFIHFENPVRASKIYDEIGWPIDKPAAFLTIDDRAFLFRGQWPTIEALKNFKPWNKP